MSININSNEFNSKNNRSNYSKSHEVIKNEYIESEGMSSFKNIDEDNKEINEFFGYDLNELNKKEIFKKAARHLKDCYYRRKIVHFPENKKLSIIIRKSYIITSNPVWNFIICLNSIGFLFLSIIQSHVKNLEIENKRNYFIYLLIMENIILSLFFLDIISFSLMIYYKKKLQLQFYNNNKSIIHFFRKYSLLILKIITLLICIVDTNIFYVNIFFYNNDNYIRFSEVFRIFFIIYYFNSIRENVICLFYSYSKFFDLLFFFIFLISIFSLIGNIFLDIDIEILKKNKYFDSYLNDFNNFFVIFNSMFAFLSFDNYPLIFYPYITDSLWSLLFFFPYLIISLVYILSIPTAVLFEKFRIKRSIISWKKNLIEKQALFNAFIVLTYKKEEKEINSDEFYKLNKEFISKNFKIENSNKIFKILDIDDKKVLTFEKFSNYIDLYYNNPSYFFVDINIKIWNKIRNFLNNKFKIDKIIDHKYFNLSIYIVIIFNTVVIVFSFFKNITDIINVNKIDEYLVFFYLVENILKIIGLGAQNYFSYTWNITYFTLIFISVLLFFTLNVFNFIIDPNIELVIELFKRQIILAKLVKNIKILNKIKYFKTIVNQSINVFVKILWCLKSIFTTFFIIMILIYIYSIIGREIFIEENNISLPLDYNLLIKESNSFLYQFIQLFFIISENGWSKRILYCAHKKDNLFKCSLFYNSFYFIVRIILINLLVGQILEFFSIIDIDIFLNENKTIIKKNKKICKNEEILKKITKINKNKKTKKDKKNKKNKNNIIYKKEKKSQISDISIENESINSKSLYSKNNKYKSNNILNYSSIKNNKEEENFEMLFSTKKIKFNYLNKSTFIKNKKTNKEYKQKIVKQNNYEFNSSEFNSNELINSIIDLSEEFLPLEKNTSKFKKFQTKNFFDFKGTKKNKYYQTNIKSKSNIVNNIEDYEVISELEDSIYKRNEKIGNLLKILRNNKKNIYDYLNKYEYYENSENIFFNYFIDYLNYNINKQLFNKNETKQKQKYSKSDIKSKTKTNNNSLYFDDNNNSELKTIKRLSSNKFVKINTKKKSSKIENKKKTFNLNLKKLEIGNDLYFFLMRSLNLLKYEHFSIFNLLGTLENLINDNYCKKGFFKFIFVLKNNYLGYINSSFNKKKYNKEIQIINSINNLINLNCKNKEIYFFENINSKLTEYDRINFQKDMIKISSYTNKELNLSRNIFKFFNNIIFLRCNFNNNKININSKIKEIYLFSFQYNKKLSNNINKELKIKRKNEDEIVKTCYNNLKRKFRIKCAEFSLFLKQLTITIFENKNIILENLK